MNMEHPSVPLHHDEYPNCSWLFQLSAHTSSLLSPGSDKRQKPRFFFFVVSWYSTLLSWFPMVWLHLRWICFCLFLEKVPWAWWGCPNLGRLFFFYKHCLPDFGQPILTALLTSLCIMINFERAAMQEDEMLKLQQELCPCVTKPWKHKDMFLKCSWKKNMSGADMVCDINHVVPGAFLLIV